MRKYRKLVVKLSGAEERHLGELLRAGVQSVRVIKRAQTLRLLAAGESPPRVGRSVGLTARGVRHIGWRYVNQNLSAALYDRPWPGAPPRIKAAEKQRIIAMVCTDPPEGRARWTIRLIAEEAVKRKLVPQIGRESVRLLLESHDLKPWREKNVVRRRT
jgi:putative transposase